MSQVQADCWQTSWIDHTFIVLQITDNDPFVLIYAQLRFTATNGFRITMVSLSQLQLCRVVGIVWQSRWIDLAFYSSSDNSQGKQAFYVQLVSTDEKSEHLKWSQWSSSLNFNWVELLLVRRDCWQTCWIDLPLYYSSDFWQDLFVFMPSCALTASTGFRIAIVSLSQLQPSWFGIIDNLEILLFFRFLTKIHLFSLLPSSALHRRLNKF